MADESKPINKKRKMSDPNSRMQQAVERLLTDLDKRHLRPMRKESFLCSAKCCDSATSNEQLQQCVNSCGAKVGKTEQMVSQELEQFQQRLQRCAMICSDKAQEQMPSDPAKQTPELAARLQGEVESCANKCVDSHTGSLKKIAERVDQAVRRS